MHKPVTYLHKTKTNHNPKSLGSHNLKPHDRTVLTTTPHNLSYPSFMIKKTQLPRNSISTGFLHKRIKPSNLHTPNLAIGRYLIPMIFVNL